MKKYLLFILIIALVSLRISVFYIIPPTQADSSNESNTEMQETDTSNNDVLSANHNKDEKDHSSQSESLDFSNKYLNAIKIGGEWFLNNQNDNFVYYQYNPYDKRHPNETQKLREMGGLWSITQLANFLDDDAYTELAQKGFAYFEQTFDFDEDNDFMIVNITPQKVKIGYSAFAILTLLEIEHPKKDFYLEELADGLIYQQNEDGELRTFFYSDRDTGKDYYPGESLVALMSLYEYTDDERYLDTVKKAFPHYVEYFRGNPNTAFVPWQSRAYEKLYNATGDQEVADFIFEMNDYMLEENEPREKCSDFAFPRSGTTSVFMEGVNKAYDVAVKLKDTERASCYANFIKEGADLMLTLQIPEDTDLEIEAVGGFLGSKSSTSQRVDRNQHATMALMEAYESGLL